MSSSALVLRGFDTRAGCVVPLLQEVEAGAHHSADRDIFPSDALILNTVRERAVQEDARGREGRHDS